MQKPQPKPQQRLTCQETRLYLWIRLKKQTGSLKHQVTGLNAVKLDRQKPAQYVGQHPDACLHEIAKHFDCTAAAVAMHSNRWG